MSWTAGGIIQASDVSNWYTSLNTTIGNYGGGIAQLSNPIGQNRDVYASDLNNLVTKLNELKNDAYLKNASYGSYSSVSRGQIIKTADWTGINSSISSLAGVKCRNNATFANGTCSYEKHSQGTCGNGSYGNGKDQHGGKDFNNTCVNVGKSNGTNSNGEKSNGNNSKDTKVDIWNANKTA